MSRHLVWQRIGSLKATPQQSMLKSTKTSNTNNMRFNVKKISGSALHNAFTDICCWQGYLYCCFREAQNHVSPDGSIAILKLDIQGKVLSKTRLIESHTDLRDPKLSVHPNGKLCLLAWRKRFNTEGQYQDGKAVSYFSGDGQSWSAPGELGDSGWWLWRIRWHNKLHPLAEKSQSTAYGFAYNRGANAIQLYSGDPFRSMHRQKDNVLSLETHGLGYPNESDMVFIGDNAWSIVRRDADSYSAQVGQSKWPFNRWQWHDLGQYLGGPCMLQIPNGQILVCARVWRENKLFTQLFSLDLHSKVLRAIADLPSAGDNSYPGMASNRDKLYISYYSGHEDQKSQIYLAIFDLKDLNKIK